MNLMNYGVTDADLFFKNVALIKTKTGEVLVSYVVIHSNGVVMFLPMELEKTDDYHVLVPYLPFVKERIFYLSHDDIQIMRTGLSDSINDRYEKHTHTIYKNDIEELIHSNKEMKDTEDLLLVTHGAVTVH